MKRILQKATFALIACMGTGTAYAEGYYGEDWKIEAQAEAEGSFFVGGEWLYWKMEEQRLETASDVTIISDAPGVFFINSKVLVPGFKEKNGYRLFGGYATADQLWNATASYTHMPSNASVNFIADPATIDTHFAGILIDNFPILSIIPPLSNLGARWNADVDYVDVDISRKIFLCDTFVIQPHMGIRGQWLDQKFRIESTDPISFFTRFKTKFCGIGLEGGLWGSWNLPYGLSVIGHVGGALSYNKVRNSAELVSEDESLTINASYSNHVSTTWIDTFIGLAYTNTMCGLTFNLHAGWEHHTIFNTNQFSVSSGGDMTMQGLTLGGFIEF